MAAARRVEPGALVHVPQRAEGRTRHVGDTLGEFSGLGARGVQVVRAGGGKRARGAVLTIPAPFSTSIHGPDDLRYQLAEDMGVEETTTTE